jgi:ribosome-binding protein aMBF1 (putative translation factor)
MLAETLREARRKKGWSILHLSKRSGVSWWVIRRIEDESPSYVPSEGNVALLAEALRMPVAVRRYDGVSDSSKVVRLVEEIYLPITSAK